MKIKYITKEFEEDVRAESGYIDCEKTIKANYDKIHNYLYQLAKKKNIKKIWLYKTYHKPPMCDGSDGIEISLMILIKKKIKNKNHIILKKLVNITDNKYFIGQLISNKT